MTARAPASAQCRVKRVDYPAYPGGILDFTWNRRRIDNMPAKGIQGGSSPMWKPSATDLEPGQERHSHGNGTSTALTLKGLPVDKSRTGRSRATNYMQVLNVAVWGLLISFSANLLFYAIGFLYQDVATAANITNNFGGTALILSLLGGFLADTLLGNYTTIVTGVVIQIVGLAIFVFSATYSDLQPPKCTPTPLAMCPPAGGKYTAVFFTGLYTIALGLGLVNASLAPFGADQFDDADEEEKQESVHVFIWLYFSQSIGTALAFTSTVYILFYKSKGWGFGYLLPLLVLGLGVFLAGTPKYRHRRVGGSFITRMTQVAVAAFLKRRLPVPENDSSLHDEPVSGGWLKRSNKLRFLDKASIVEENSRIKSTSKWRLTGISQVEEAKRIFRLFPVWAPTCLLSIGFAQAITYTAAQASTLDRNLGPHFTLPAVSLGISVSIITAAAVPIYDKIVVPVFKKLTGTQYGIPPLRRITFGCLFIVVGMITAALVERKRISYVRRLGYTHFPIFTVPMKVWWLLPQYFFTATMEFLLYVPLYEFYFHEVSDATRSIAISFLFSALAVGNFLSAVLTNLTNSITKHHRGGAWLKERLNDGGLENHYSVLAAILGANFFVLLVTTHFYDYNYDMFRSDGKKADSTDQGVAGSAPPASNHEALSRKTHPEEAN